MARSQALLRLVEHPDLTAQRHYEICRAYFLERLTAVDVAERFGVPVGSIRVRARDFARDPDLGQFFRTPQAADRPPPKRESIRDRACSPRNHGLTLAESRARLDAEGHPVSEAYLFRLLRPAGLASKGQRCRSVRQPGGLANDGSPVPAIAAGHQLALTNGRQFTPTVAGLFLSLPRRLALDLPSAVRQAGLPGSEQIPPLQAFLALPPPLLLGHRRIRHVSALGTAEGAGLWPGLNVLPKAT